MTPVVGHDFEVAKWVGLRIGSNIEPPFTAIGFADHSGVIVAGAVFNDYQPKGNVEMTLAADRPLTRGILRVIAEYVFKQLGCARLTVRTRQANKKVCSMTRRAGFTREAGQKDFYGPGDNAELFRMLKKECRWFA